MKTLFCGLILVISVLAEPISTFEVRELDPAMVQKLKSAEVAVDAATVALTSAQEALKKAQVARDKVKNEALGTVNAFAREGQCASTGTARDGAASFGINYRRLFTRVEIRGKYVLITAGSEDCNGLIITGSDLGGSGGTISLVPGTGSGSSGTSGVLGGNIKNGSPGGH